MQQLPWEIISVDSNNRSLISNNRGKRSKFKRIVISERNYLALKRLGYAGDSFNDVISKLLRIERSYQEMKKQQEQQNQKADQQGRKDLLLWRRV
jgi:predicted CopG family antitoxin